MKKLLLLFLPLVCQAQTKIALIDTGLDLTNEHYSSFLCTDDTHKDFTGEGIEDYVGHGTAVTYLLTKNILSSDYCLRIYKYYQEENKNNQENYLKALKKAIEDAPDFINISGGGQNFIQDEYKLIADHPLIKFVVAAGNEGKELSSVDECFFPACLSSILLNVITVGALDSPTTAWKMSNYGPLVMAWEPGVNILVMDVHNNKTRLTGTSMAAPVHLARIVNETN